MENMFINKVVKHGNTLAVTLPVNISRYLSIERGDYVVGMVTKESAVLFVKIKEQDLAYYRQFAEEKIPVIIHE